MIQTGNFIPGAEITLQRKILDRLYTVRQPDTATEQQRKQNKQFFHQLVPAKRVILLMYRASLTLYAVVVKMASAVNSIDVYHFFRA
jgi:hypothetical protein